MTIPSRLAAMLALMVTLFVAVAMPSAASAHPHHAHGVKAVQGSSVNADAAVKRPAAALALQELKASPVIDASQSSDTDCDERGCCASGHCHGFGTAITTSSAVGFAVSNGALIRSRDIPAPSGLATDGPARPPRTFA